MKNVIGIDRMPVITARYGPSAAGTTSTTQSAIAVTMPVPLSTPTSTPAASTIETTPTMLGAWATISSAWLRTFGKLTMSAIAAPIMNTNGSGTTSITSSTMTASSAPPTSAPPVRSAVIRLSRLPCIVIDVVLFRR